MMLNFWLSYRYPFQLGSQAMQEKAYSKSEVLNSWLTKNWRFAAENGLQ
jgi:hypothetical protein